jgi:hypothetical protein
LVNTAGARIHILVTCVIVWRIPARNRVVDVDTDFIALAWVAEFLKDIVADVADRLDTITSVNFIEKDPVITKTVPVHIAVTPSVDFVRINPVVCRTALFLAQARQHALVLSNNRVGIGSEQRGISCGSVS